MRRCCGAELDAARAATHLEAELVDERVEGGRVRGRGRAVEDHVELCEVALAAEEEALVDVLGAGQRRDEGLGERFAGLVVL